MTEVDNANSPHEFKAMLLFALIFVVVAIAGGLAYLRYVVRSAPVEDGITYAADGSMIITSAGQEVKIRKRSTGVLQITRTSDPNLEIILNNVRGATLDSNLADKVGLTKLQVSALKQINLVNSSDLTRSQRDVIETAYSLYVSAGGAPATAATRAASAPAGGSLAGPAESALLAAVSRLNDDPRLVPPWRRVDRVRQVITAEQFENLSKKETPSAAPRSPTFMGAGAIPEMPNKTFVPPATATSPATTTK